MKIKKCTFWPFNNIVKAKTYNTLQLYFTNEHAFKTLYKVAKRNIKTYAELNDI